MEYVLMLSVILFILPFPKKWKFVRRLRLLSVALGALVSGVTLIMRFDLPGQIGGGVLFAVAVAFFYLALRKPARQASKKA
jgi:multisubunit Na+/H+ antiporter MnhB subunit